MAHQPSEVDGCVHRPREVDGCVHRPRKVDSNSLLFVFLSMYVFEMRLSLIFFFSCRYVCMYVHVVLYCFVQGTCSFGKFGRRERIVLTSASNETHRSGSHKRRSSVAT